MDLFGWLESIFSVVAPWLAVPYRIILSLFDLISVVYRFLADLVQLSDIFEIFCPSSIYNYLMTAFIFGLVVSVISLMIKVFASVFSKG